MSSQTHTQGAGPSWRSSNDHFSSCSPVESAARVQSPTKLEISGQGSAANAGPPLKHTSHHSGRGALAIITSILSFPSCNSHSFSHILFCFSTFFYSILQSSFFFGGIPHVAHSTNTPSAGFFTTSATIAGSRHFGIHQHDSVIKSL